MVVREVGELGELSEAEERVLADLDSGEITVLGDGVLPEAGDAARRVRASLIRLLLLGDDPDPKYRLHETGIQIAGAWIPDQLDLDCSQDLPSIALDCCRFDATPSLQSAIASDIFLEGSLIPGLQADRLETSGSLSLRKVQSSHEIRLANARIGSNLDLSDSTLNGRIDSQGDFVAAVFADGIECRRSVILGNLTAVGEVNLRAAVIGGALECSEAVLSGLLSNGKRGLAFSADELRSSRVFFKNVRSTGEVRLAAARLDGDLTCTGARFCAEEEGKQLDRPALVLDKLDVKGSIFLDDVRTRGETRLNSAKVNGAIFCVGSKFGTAEDERGPSPPKVLNFNSAWAGGGLTIRDGSTFNGALDLTAAEFGYINDEIASWPKKGLLILDRCRYGALIGKSPTDAKSRIDWLGRQDHKLWGVNFWPQPYEQCAKVLREMGHGEDARAVLIEKEQRQRAARRARVNPFYRAWLWLWDWLLWAVVDYGRQPLWAFAWLGMFLVTGWFTFHLAVAYGAIKPNNAVTLRSEEWVACQDVGVRARIACFEATPRGASYPQFNALIYSADTLLPIVSLEMQEYWIPDEDTGRGAVARVYLWVHIAVGWALSLLAVAGFSGLVKSD